MPTPLSVARQCLAEEAAAALNDAVAVAKRRSHSQTTSLHAVSALLSLPSSALREACTRAGRSSYSPRLQLRALELCVGVALDKVSVSKTVVDEPPVSNSLMAAIKRSQANQKRHPETFHLYQQQLNSNSQNCASISAVKVDLKHFVTSILDDPIVNRVFSDAGFRTNEIKWTVLNPSVARFSTISSFPTLFSCGLSDLELNKGRTFPFAADSGGNADDSSKRIGEVLARRNKRNPLLIGVYANDTLVSFVDGVKRGENGVLPKEIDGLSVVSIDREVSEFMNGCLSEEIMGLKFKHVGEMVDNCQSPGILVNCGNLKGFVDVENVDSVNYMVCHLKRLLSNSGGKLWLIGALAGDYDYKKILDRFPSIEVDWDLHLLPVTNPPKTSSIGGMSFKSSLMGSFVPLGGFFSMPPKHETLRTTATESSTLCTLCNEKYEKEVSAILKGDLNKSAVDQHAINLSPWLRVAACQTSDRSDTIKAQNDKNVLDAKVKAIQRKWNEICQQLHFSWTSQENISPAKSQTSSACTSSPPAISVTTDLRLGTLYSSEKEPSGKLDMQEHHNVTQNFTESYTAHEYIPNQVAQSSSSSQKVEKQMYTKDLEPPWKVLAETIYWQTEAIQTICQTVSRCSNKRNIWLSFVGPDKVAKRKIAAAVAEIVFGKKENMLSLDMGSHDMDSPSNSIFDNYGTKYHGRQMIVDYLAEELGKSSKSVVLLEDMEKADFLVRNSLVQAVKTGKFRNSHGRDININNKVFILTSTIIKGRENPFGQVKSEFSEEKIFEAKNFQMQLSVGALNGNDSRYSSTNVSITPSEKMVVKKRKLIDNEPTKATMLKRQLSRSVIDLNLPVEDTEDDRSVDKSDDNDDDDNESSENSTNSTIWLKEVLEHVDENVVFKPFDFDVLAQNILKEINMRLKRVVGDGILLEINRNAMVQILAAFWSTDRKDKFDDWIEQTLCTSIKKARENCHVTSSLVIKLVSCDGHLVEEQASGICLPARINLI